MYNKIFDFCKVRNLGSCFKNSPDEPTPRVDYITHLLDSESISWEMDKFKNDGITLYNIILRGSSNKMVVAHHDIVNPDSDNANDNSASVINALMVKKLRPDINVVILDGEEIGGVGSQRLSDMINGGEFGIIDWVLNFELTGRGGKYFFIGDYPGKLSDRIIELFPECPITKTPFNDSVIFRENGIDSCVINPVPPTIKYSDMKWGDNVNLDYTILFNCHSKRDSLLTIKTGDMKEFVEEVVLKILE
jgi:hypothetical protein